VSNPTQAFFHGLEERRADPRAGHVKGTVRVDVDDGKRVESWLVWLDRGAVKVTRNGADAGCVVRTDRATFDGLAEGRVNTMAALLRGTVRAQGNLELLLYLQRLFPAPERSG
jgi:putative sterol carrier protein